jgi:PAS domain S-box-containing protein
MLEQSEEHFRIIEKLARLGSWRLDLDSLIVSASEEACRIYGLELNKYPVNVIQSLVLPEYRSEMDTQLDNLINSKGEYNIQFKIKNQKDGSIRDIHSIAEYNEEKRTVTGVIHDITEGKTIERELQESEERYRTLFNNSVSGIIYTDINGQILEANQKMLQILGSPSLEATKKINVLTFPLLVDVGFSADFRQVFETQSVVQRSVKYLSKWGTEHYLEYVLNPVKHGSIITRVIGKIEDITERKNDEIKIDALLLEKEILLREIHHRLKNNMASIAGLLRIQLENSDDNRVIAPLKDAVGRLNSMRILYDKLYLSADFIHTSIEEYLTSLIDEIFEVFPESQDVEIVKNIENFPIPSDKIFPLGLIINELLTNAFKYAFIDEHSTGKLEISVALSDADVRLIVKDNGRGYADLDAAGKKSGFGLRLIRMLTAQIGGAVEFNNDNGAVCVIDFKLDETA